jgi:hypothetical protein
MAEESFLKNYQFLSESRNSPHFTEPGSSVRCSQLAVIVPYPKQHLPVTHPPILLLFYHLRLRIPGGLPWVSPPKPRTDFPFLLHQMHFFFLTLQNWTQVRVCLMARDKAGRRMPPRGSTQKLLHPCKNDI